MKAFSSLRPSPESLPQPKPESELDWIDFTQEIDATLEELRRRDEPTLTQRDFEGLELTLR